MLVRKEVIVLLLNLVLFTVLIVLIMITVVSDCNSDVQKANMMYIWLTLFFQCHHMPLMDFVVSPPGCGRSVTDFKGWDAHEAQLRCPDDVWIWGTRRGLKPKFYVLNYPDHGRHGDLPLEEKIPMAEPGIEPGTAWTVVRNSDHQTTRLVTYDYLKRKILTMVLMMDVTVIKSCLPVANVSQTWLSSGGNWYRLR
jgi:hypothetical protein